MARRLEGAALIAELSAMLDGAAPVVLPAGRPEHEATLMGGVRDFVDALIFRARIGSNRDRCAGDIQGPPLPDFGLVSTVPGVSVRFDPAVLGQALDTDGKPGMLFVVKAAMLQAGPAAAGDMLEQRLAMALVLQSAGFSDYRYPAVRWTAAGVEAARFSLTGDVLGALVTARPLSGTWTIARDAVDLRLFAQAWPGILEALKH